MSNPTKTKFAMLAKDLDDKKIEFPCYVEPKYDGVRVLAKVNKKERTVDFFFRSGKEVYTLEHLKSELLAIDADQNEFTVDGEVVSKEGFMVCVGDVRRKKKQAPQLQYKIFDLFYEEDDRDYLTRKAKLNFLGITFLECVRFVKCNNIGEVIHLKGIWESDDGNIEGVMVKKNTKYQHKRTWDWMKLKDELSVDFPIVEVFEGKGKYKNMLGGIAVENPQTKVTIRVGGGFTDSERNTFWRTPNDLIGKTAEIKYQYMTPKGSLRHPIFKGLRIDK